MISRQISAALQQAPPPAYYKFDHNLNVTQSSYLLNKNINNETVTITYSSGICRAMCLNGSYLLLFGKRQ